MRVDEETRTSTEFDIVDDNNVESAILQKSIGERIRRLRMRKSMGLVDLGKKTGLSASFLSQLETGRVVPTVRNLARIAMVFNQDLAYFFREDAPINMRVQSSTERVRIQRNLGQDVTFLSESMSSLVADGSMTPCIAEFRADKEEVIFHPRVHEGIEFTMIIEGALTLVSENETRTLETGDVAWLDSQRKRHYTCHAGTRARAMIITRGRRN